MALDDLVAQLREFAAERDWEQFHTPKNLAMAVAGEAGELLAELQWLTPEESAQLSDERLAAVAAEMADVFIYLLRLSDVLGVDLLQAAQDKLAVNRRRYSVERSRGSAQKLRGRRG